MANTDPKYQIGTPENKKFLDISRDNLIAFGRRFPAVDGSSYWATTAPRGRTATAPPGSPAA